MGKGRGEVGGGSGEASTESRVQGAAKWSGKNKYFQRIQFDFLCSTNFTLLSEIKGNPIRECIFSVHNFCSGRPV